MRFFSFPLRRAALPSTQEREGHMPYCRPRGHGKGHTPHCRQGRAHTALPSAQTGKACAAMPSTQARRTYAAMSVCFPCIDVHRWRQSICPLGQRFPPRHACADRSAPIPSCQRPAYPCWPEQAHPITGQHSFPLPPPHAVFSSRDRQSQKRVWNGVLRSRPAFLFQLYFFMRLTVRPDREAPGRWHGRFPAALRQAVRIPA